MTLTDWKFDKGKFRPSLLPWRGIRAVLAVLEFGAKKYAPHSWSTVEPERYLEALGRHTLELLERYRTDPNGLHCLDDESGLPTVAHLACNALFLLAHPALAKKETNGTTKKEN